MVAPSLTARRTRLFVDGTLMMMRIQRLERRSYRMRGSLVLDPLTTEVKNTSGSAFNTPSATPVVLLNERNRPLTKTMYWDGPTAPMLSGGKELVSESVAPVKLTPRV